MADKDKLAKYRTEIQQVSIFLLATLSLYISLNTFLYLDGRLGTSACYLEVVSGVRPDP